MGDPNEDDEPKEEKKLTLDGLMQVMAMGAGAPMLGDLKKTNFEKPESEGGAALQFELEANNFDLDARGEYFDNGSTATPVAGMFDQFMPKEEEKEDGEAKDEKKLTLDGLMQVMAMGAGGCGVCALCACMG